MLFFLRTKENEDILGIEIYESKFTNTICSNMNLDILKYSKFLIRNIDESDRILEFFYKMQNLNTSIVLKLVAMETVYSSLIKYVREEFKKFGEDFNLQYSED